MKICRQIIRFTFKFSPLTWVIHGLSGLTIDSSSSASSPTKSACTSSWVRIFSVHLRMVLQSMSNIFRSCKMTHSPDEEYLVIMQPNISIPAVDVLTAVSPRRKTIKTIQSRFEGQSKVLPSFDYKCPCKSPLSARVGYKST